jgi:hypothetical protein
VCDVQLGAGVAQPGSPAVEGVVMASRAQHQEQRDRDDLIELLELAVAGGGANTAALEDTIKILGDMGRLEPVDAARVQALRSMAASLDVRPFNSQMWREYREALEGLTAHDSDDGALEALLAELSSPVRNPPKG